MNVNVEVTEIKRKNIFFQGKFPINNFDRENFIRLFKLLSFLCLSLSNHIKAFLLLFYEKKYHYS